MNTQGIGFHLTLAFLIPALTVGGLKKLLERRQTDPTGVHAHVQNELKSGNAPQTSPFAF